MSAKFDLPAPLPPAPFTRPFIFGVRRCGIDYTIDLINVKQRRGMMSVIKIGSLRSWRNAREEDDAAVGAAADVSA